MLGLDACSGSISILSYTAITNINSAIYLALHWTPLRQLTRDGASVGQLAPVPRSASLILDITSCSKPLIVIKCRSKLLQILLKMHNVQRVHVLVPYM